MKRIITLTGPSCAGKTTLERRLVELGARRTISVTTRPPRAGETDGEDYYFVSRDKLMAMGESGQLVELAQFGEHWYGTSAAELERLFLDGETVVIVCDPLGARQIWTWAGAHPEIELRQVFVDGDEHELANRFLARFYEDMRPAATFYQKNAMAAVLAQYSRRLVLAQGIERAWVAEAHDRAHPDNPHRQAHEFRYSQIIPRLDADNLDAVAHGLL